MASLPVVAVSTFIPRRSSTLLSAKMLRASSSTSKHRSADQVLVGTVQSLQHLLLCSREIRDHAVQEQATSRRAGARANSTPFTTTLRAMVWSCASSSADNSRPVKTTTGISVELCVLADPLQHLEARHIRQLEVEHDAVDGRFAKHVARASRPSDGRNDLDVVVAEKLVDAQLLGRDCPRRPGGACGRGLAYSLIRVERRLDALAVVVGLVTKEKAPRASPCWRSSSRVMICTGIWRVSGFCFSWLSTRPAEHVRQEDVEGNRGRLVLLGERQAPRAPRVATSTLKPLSRARSTRMRA